MGHGDFMLSHLLANLTNDSVTQMFFLAPLLLILLDVLTGVVAAIKRGVFRAAELSDFARNNLLPYASILGTYLMLPLLQGVTYVAAADGAKAVLVAFCVGQIGSVVENLGLVLNIPGFSIEAAVTLAAGRLFPFLNSTQTVTTTTTPVVTATTELIVVPEHARTATAELPAIVVEKGPTA